MTPPYDPLSGGIKVMWGLYGYLLARGQEAYTNSTSDDPDSFVAIYPEIYQGNQAQARRVVRYLLNEPGAMALYGTPGPTTFDKKDLIYTFSKMYYDTDDEHTLFLPIIDLYTFKDLGRKRKITAYFVGKGTNTNQHPKDAIQITRELAKDQHFLAELLNDCQVLYSYDPVSAMTELARLCGCRVRMCQTKYTKEQYELYEPGLNGMGFDKDVGLDTPEFRHHYQNMIKTFNERLDQFIISTQRWKH